jgi:hypothetical protein
MIKTLLLLHRQEILFRSREAVPKTTLVFGDGLGIDTV